MKIDLRWKVPTKNQMWLRWKKVVNDGSGKITLKDAEFFGPVLEDCEKMEQSGFIRLDLTKHFILIIPKPYIIELKWSKIVSQDTEKIVFEEIVLEDGDIGLLNKLKTRDLLLLDCTGHTTEEEARGKYRAAYNAMLYNESLTPYDFS